MLQNLHIKNLALIPEEEIEFGEGLNILTGETGAGKSIILGSVNLALGARADADMIRTGAEYALAELLFTLDADEEARIRDLGFSPEEDHTLLVARKISPGRSVCRVGGETVTAAKLKELAEVLLDIHGQHDHASLLRPAKQKQILDAYCGEKLAEALAAMKKLHGEYLETKRMLEESRIDESARLREIDLISYEIDEIDGARIRPGEIAELEKNYRRMSGARRVEEALQGACHILENGASGGESLTDALGRARRELAQIPGEDENITSLLSQIDDIDGLLGDLSRALSDTQEEYVFDESDLAAAEERVNLLNRLQDKYGQSEEEILQAADERRERLEFLTQIEERRAEAQERLSALEEKERAQCAKITKLRKKGAEELSEKIRGSLVDCNFLEVRFVIDVTADERTEAITGDGWDTVRFDIQTNPGESMRPLDQIASGGELSRIMLGIKTVLADEKDTPTLIFDEIDAGISGRTAWRVAEKLGGLSSDHQILCITHLPQIAAMADTHYCIEKQVQKDRTVTRIRSLEQEESIGELARLLSADEVTEEVLENARQLREKAQKEKAGRKKK